MTKISIAAGFKYRVWFNTETNEWLADIVMRVPGDEDIILHVVNKEQASNMNLMKIVAAIEEKEAQDGLL